MMSLPWRFRICIGSSSGQPQHGDDKTARWGGRVEKRVRKVFQDLRIVMVIAMVLFLLFRNEPRWSGLWLGLLVGIINWHGLSTAAHRAVWLPVEQAQRYMVLNYVIRYGLRFIVLAVALISYELNPVTLLIGLTAPTAIAVISYSLQKK